MGAQPPRKVVIEERRPGPNGVRFGVVLANLGSPNAPTPAALRRYLREFLADPRVVDLPRLRWWLLRNLIVIPARSRRSARLYREIWTPEGSPLVVATRRLAKALAHEIESSRGRSVPVVAGMRYGSPSIARALTELHEHGVRKILVLPLYPQYSATTTASVGDAACRAIESWSHPPDLGVVTGYHDHPGYIDALADSVHEMWTSDGRPQRLILSFHGLPVRYVEAGDPYLDQCRATAAALADRLDIDRHLIVTGFQSRFGREPWIGPATDELIAAAGREVEGLDVLCPGFATDCLETLEEIATTGRRIFEEAGGRSFRYIPALNDRREHATALAEIVADHLAPGALESDQRESFGGSVVLTKT